MTIPPNDGPTEQETAGPPRRLRLPGFLIDDDAGLGDVIRRTTSYLGVRPCDACDRRADALNRWLVFTKREAR